MGKIGGHAYPDPLFKKSEKNILSTIFFNVSSELGVAKWVSSTMERAVVE